VRQARWQQQGRLRREGEGQGEIAKAELEFNYTSKPSDSAKIAIAKADADYDVAKEMCDDKKGNDKDVCVKDAKAAHAKAIAEAKASKS
jgi:hypothetical protein